MSVTPQQLAAVGLPTDAVVTSAGGATGRSWKVTTSAATFALRQFRSADVATGPLAAMEAAGAAGLPTGTVLNRADTPLGHVVLCTWLPGIPLLDAARQEPTSAGRLGVLLGETQRELHRVQAPDALAAAIDTAPDHQDAAAAPPVPQGRALLHLDWHPLNVLVSDGQLSGVLDWENAHSGHPLLDLARTHTVMRLDPMLDSLPAPDQELLRVLVDGWQTGYGPQTRALPAACLTWAGRWMLADLSARYAASPSALRGVRHWTEGWEQRARGGTEQPR